MAIAFDELENELSQSNSKQTQWTTFLAKAQLSAPHRFDDLLQQIATIAVPILNAVLNQSEFDMNWKPGGPWTKR